MIAHKKRTFLAVLVGMVLAPIAVACGPLTVPGPRTDTKPVARYNGVVVRIWRHASAGPSAAPYVEYRIRREDVPTDLMPVLEVALADSTARVEVINRHGEIDPLPDGTPLPCSAF